MMAPISNSTCSSPVSSSSSSISSFNSTLTWKYDVFLSFRGLDTRNSFCDHLYKALVEKGIKVFRDDKNLQKGKVITQTIFRAIHTSRFSIVVLSRNFACSEWCLDELVEIIGCKNEKRHLTFPVFYHLKPDHVMNQTGCYGKFFARHELNFEKERVQKWRAALTEISGVSGWDALNHRSESKLVRVIVEQLSHSLKSSSPKSDDRLVPLTSRAKPMELYFYEGIDNMGIVRICGTDGMSHTTMARIVYDAVIHEKWGNDRFQELVSEMPKECTKHTWDMDTIFYTLRKTMVKKKVLLLVDHIDTLEHLVFIVNKHAHGWVVPNSRIVVSARTSCATIFNALDMSFQVPETTELNIRLDIALFVPEMDDSHVTKILRSLVSTNLCTNNGMEVVINKTVIHASDIYDHITRHEHPVQKGTSPENVEEDLSMLLDMCIVDIFKGDNNMSSQSSRKTTYKPKHGSVDTNSGYRKIRKHNLVKSSVKAREKDSLSMSLPIRNRGRTEAGSAIVEDSRNTIESNGSCGDGLVNLQKVEVLMPNSMASILDDTINEEKIVPSRSYNALQSISPRKKAASSPSLEMFFSNKARDRKLQYFKPEMLKGTKIVRIPEAVVVEGVKQWELCLVGQLMGKCSATSLMTNKANQLWGNEGRIQVTKTENELYIFKFPNEKLRDRVLESGPWYIENEALVLRMWEPDMKLSQLDNSKVPVWVKLIGIPMLYLTKLGVSYIASALGKPLYIAAADKFCIDFVKVCVEVSTEDDVTDFVTVMGCDGEEVRVEVEYLWKPDKCIACKQFGHSYSKCPRFELMTGKAD